MQARKDALTSGKIETGLVFEQMLGPEDARSYLQAEGVPEAIIARVLAGTFRRPGSSESRPGGGFYAGSGRRKDVVQSCIVQAALALRAQLGNERIARLLRREKLPEAVIARVVRGDAATLRARPAPVSPQSPTDQVSSSSMAGGPSA